MSKYLKISGESASKLKRLLQQPDQRQGGEQAYQGSDYVFRWVTVGDELTSSPYTYDCTSTVYDAAADDWTDGEETTMRLRACDDGQLTTGDRVIAQLWGYDDDADAWYVCQRPAASPWTYTTHTLSAHEVYEISGNFQALLFDCSVGSSDLGCKLPADPEIGWECRVAHQYANIFFTFYGNGHNVCGTSSVPLIYFGPPYGTDMASFVFVGGNTGWSPIDFQRALSCECVPTPPYSGNYVLSANNGTLSWVAGGGGNNLAIATAMAGPGSRGTA